MFMEFDRIDNVRQLGGMTRADGAKIREGILLRTGKLETATDGDIKQLSDMGLAHIFDFRDEREVAEHPDRPVPGAEYHHLPALGNLSCLFTKRPDDPTMTPEEVHHDFTLLYRFLAQSPESLEAYETFFRILLESGGRPVLWHCTQGKDRTGIAAMLLLTALGFEEEAVLQEYLLTNRFAQTQYGALEGKNLTPKQMDMMREVLFVYEENARFYLDCLRLEYGSVKNFLELALGIGPKEIEKLEKYYLETE